MNGAEWIEISQQASSNALAAFAIFLTMFSGYLVVAYSVGSRLSTFQVSFVNVVYLLSSMTVLWANYASIRDAMAARQQASVLVQQFPMGAAIEPMLVANAILAVNSLFLLGSLIFMYSVRRA